MVQPYVLWLMKVARQIAPAFHGTLRGLFGDRYSAGPIKGFLRCAEKVRAACLPVLGVELPMFCTGVNTATCAMSQPCVFFVGTGEVLPS